MKGLLVFAVSTLLSVAAMAQGNLQFNQVKNIVLSYTTPNSNSYQTYNQTITVPAGKVWKIESVIGSAQGPTTNYVSPTTTITLDGVVLFFYVSGSNNYQWAPLPIWLPEGTYDLGLVSSSGVSTGMVISGRVSAIEFNVIP